MREEEIHLLREIEAAVRSGGGDALIRGGRAVDQYVFDLGEFPHDLFDKILEVLRGQLYQRLSDGLGLSKLFEYNLSLLTDKQKNALQDTLEDVLPRLNDPVSGFLAAELIADIWKDDRSLSALVRLKNSRVDQARALVAHGLERLARQTNIPKVRHRCLEQLNEMAKDPAVIVQMEAKVALSRCISFC